jgi:hypothetical protein
MNSCQGADNDEEGDNEVVVIDNSSDVFMTNAGPIRLSPGK